MNPQQSVCPVSGPSLALMVTGERGGRQSRRGRKKKAPTPQTFREHFYIEEIQIIRAMADGGQVTVPAGRAGSRE